MNKLQLSEFCIEVTRKCNMKCEHCLRGDAEAIHIDNKYITKALTNVESIGSLTFTGGEPSLNIDAMQFTLDELKRLDITVFNFYIVLNGRKSCQNEKMLLLLLRLYQYQEYECNSNGIGSMVQISKDKYHSHQKEQKNSISYLSALSFFSVRENKYNIDNIISEGRGFYIGRKQLSYDENVILEIDENNIRVETLIYLNAKGQICNDCDYSYNTQEENNLFNLNETTLIDGIMNL